MFYDGTSFDGGNAMNGRELDNRIAYMATCRGDFASQHAMSPAAAYAFLERYQGISFFADCYGVEHAQSVQAAVDDRAEVCIRNGGALT